MSQSRLRTILLIAGFGAVLVLVGVLGLAGALVGLALMIVATLLSAPEAPRPGASEVNWWTMIAAGTGLVAVGIPLGLGVELVGGLLTAVGGVLVVVAAALGYP